MSDEFKMVFPSRDAAISSLCHKVFGAHAVFDENTSFPTPNADATSPADALDTIEPTPPAERPTPITDAAAHLHIHETGDIVECQPEDGEWVEIKVARDLERQLAEVQEQRDALAKAGKIIADEYLDRRSQWGSEHLWAKHEDTEAVNAALAAVERSEA